MKLELDRTQAQAVAAACQIASHDWEKGNAYSQRMAKVVHDIAAKLVVCVMSNQGDMP